LKRPEKLLLRYSQRAPTCLCRSNRQSTDGNHSDTDSTFVRAHGRHERPGVSCRIIHFDGWQVRDPVISPNGPELPHVRDECHSAPHDIHWCHHPPPGTISCIHMSPDIRAKSSYCATLWTIFKHVQQTAVV
jgi:hypothetical protein